MSEQNAEELARENKLLKKRLEYFSKIYEPHEDCKSAEFNCDFFPDGTKECPCVWTMLYRERDLK